MIKDVTKVLDNLLMEYEVRGNQALALCPMHKVRTGKEDHSPSWWISVDSGMHLCFSCQYKGNLLQLICDVNEFYVTTWNDLVQYDYKTAETWLSTVAEIPVEKLVAMIKALPDYVSSLPKPVEMSEARLAVFVEPPQEELDSRSITAESAQKYGVLWDAQSKMWILPIREPLYNKLLGWQEKGTVDRTFKNRPAGLQKSKTIFGIKEQNDNLAIVVESPLDCLRIYSAGFSGAVAICGASPSEEQVKLLRGSERIIVALDNPNIDAAGYKGCKEMLHFARKYGLNMSFFNYGSSSKKDPGDMTNEEIAWGIENAISSIYGESAYVQRDAQAVPS
jgi:hypothetical protein